MIQWLRSLALNVAVYAWLPVIGLAYLPWMLVSRRGARAGCRRYCLDVQRMLPVMVGLHPEIRGTPPTGEGMVAAKHQSFLDVLMIYGAVPRGFFIMKSILRYAPVVGQYGMRIGCIPVQRGRRAEAIRHMLAQLAAGERRGGQLIIYPQGTRVAPGADKPYKVGTFAIYEMLGQPCYPVATNVGVFWPKRGVLRRPGRAVVEFLEPIPPGLGRQAFMETLERRIETASNRLMAEAGFPVGPPPHPPVGDPLRRAVHETTGLPPLEPARERD
ncbi:1-acyl-sn-glycerol-3-phosphate acyltransferase [Jannaschia sp. W003]|uniref:lysophospholipid acyltransferase family protein n=1 Tax=Jannaschia sp. W003 TaxID=2867012 RepID=UPI0021A3D8CF|nr:lysophospholipid acyltransferase family protein [Jannaschia sp. W003]UWQ22588.1 1-acyl-sn-glycerol-3-phosphate acyltransferase [Jannaschia sp. W003]